MTQYIPPTYQPPTDPNRPRTTSNPSKYIPEAYGGPSQPHTPYTPGSVPPQGRTRGPSFAGQPIIATPPVPNPGYYGTPPVGVTPPMPNAGHYGSSPGHGYFGTAPHAPEQGYLGTPHAPVAGSPYPQNQLHPGYPAAQPPQPFTPPATMVDRDGYMRPPPHQRRASASSTHSRHSHHSGRSHHSGSHHNRHSHDAGRDSHGSRRHSEDSYDDDDHDRRTRHSHENKHDDDRDMKPVKRVTSHRPSWGDTIYGMFGVIKDALGPRDKY